MSPGEAPSSAIQRAKGTKHTYLPSDQYPRKPQPVWTPGTSGPYQISTALDAWLVPGQLTGGTGPQNTKFFLDVNQRNPKVEENYQYHRSHLLAKSLGGSGDDLRNIVPLTQKANYAMRDAPETQVRDYLYRDRATGPGIVHYQVSVVSGGHNTTNISPAEKHLPTRVTVVADVHQGPANKKDVGDLGKWQETDAENSSTWNIDMALPTFSEVYPGTQYTIGSLSTAEDAVRQFIASNPDLQKGVIGQKILQGVQDVVAENQRDPTVVLKELKEYLGVKEKEAPVLRKQAAELLTETWTKTSFHSQHSDSTALDRASKGIDLSSLPEKLSSVSKEDLLNSWSLKGPVCALVHDFTDWMDTEIRKLAQASTSDLGDLDSQINQKFDLQESATRGNRLTQMARSVKTGATTHLAAASTLKSIYELIDHINMLFEKFIRIDKIMKALWTGKKDYLA